MKNRLSAFEVACPGVVIDGQIRGDRVVTTEEIKTPYPIRRTEGGGEFAAKIAPRAGEDEGCISSHELGP
jgi:hypothetical protein